MYRTARLHAMNMKIEHRGYTSTLAVHNTAGLGKIKQYILLNLSLTQIINRFAHFQKHTKQKYKTSSHQMTSNLSQKVLSHFTD